MFSQKYISFYQHLKSYIPEERLITDPLRTLAYGTDASFYRLVPKIVVKAQTEEEVSRILQTADQDDVAVTFRAAGTSLSGQAISDSVLVIAGNNWKNYEILDFSRMGPCWTRLPLQAVRTLALPIKNYWIK